MMTDERTQSILLAVRDHIGPDEEDYLREALRLAREPQWVSESLEVRMRCSSSIGEIEEWLSEQTGYDYDSIKLQCHAADTSPSGVIFTIYVKCPAPPKPQA